MAGVPAPLKAAADKVAGTRPGVFIMGAVFVGVLWIVCDTLKVLIVTVCDSG